MNDGERYIENEVDKEIVRNLKLQSDICLEKLRKAERKLSA
jgi:hypothetical protein